jgi:hypothetical protein
MRVHEPSGKDDQLDPGGSGFAIHGVSNSFGNRREPIRFDLGRQRPPGDHGLETPLFATPAPRFGEAPLMPEQVRRYDTALAHDRSSHARPHAHKNEPFAGFASQHPFTDCGRFSVVAEDQWASVDTQLLCCIGVSPPQVRRGDQATLTHIARHSNCHLSVVRHMDAVKDIEFVAVKDNALCAATTHFDTRQGGESTWGATRKKATVRAVGPRKWRPNRDRLRKMT